MYEGVFEGRGEAAIGFAPRQGAVAAPRLIIQSGFMRIDAQRFIARVFARVHGADITSFMPTLLGLRDHNGNLLCACGLRESDHQRLFVEHYLDQPVEKLLAAETGRRIARARVVEVGNLAVSAPGSARELITELTRYLSLTPRRYVVCTALPALRNAFTRLGIRLYTLGPADIERLPPAARDGWGSYYDNGPLVTAVSVIDAARALGLPGPQDGA